MHAAVDLDILCYEMGSAKGEGDLPLQWPLVQARIDSRIQQILTEVEADTWQGYLTGPGNFRDEVATIKPCKGTRKRNERPFWYPAVVNYLANDRGAMVISGMEADDAIVIEAQDDPNVVMCSRDKDLMMAEGWHYMWKFFNSKDSKSSCLSHRFWPELKKAEQKPIYVDNLTGFKFFCAQCLTGDTADNIPGLYNVGIKSTAIDKVIASSTELEAFSIVKEQYELRFGSYWDMFLAENGTLLWMKRSEEDSWYNRQKKLIGSL